MRQRLFLVTAVALSSSLAAQQHAAVTFKLDPFTTLPGVPVTFKFSITNPTSRLVRIPKWAVLQVVPAAGESFISRWEGQWVANVSSYAEQDSVAPNDAVSFAIPVDDVLASPQWFFDTRLCQPGSYTLRVLLNDKLTQEAVRGKSAAAVLSAFGDAGLLSNEVSLTVSEPVGYDAEVWDYLGREAGGEFSVGIWLGSGHELAKTIWTEYPGSTYARFVAALVPARETVDRMDILHRALAADPDGRLSEWYKLRLASLQRRKYGEAMSLVVSGQGNDRSAARIEADLAIAALSELASKAKEPLVRKLAAQELDELREDIQLDLEPN